MMYKKIIVLFALLLMLSCTKVVEVNLPDHFPKPIVEGIVRVGDTPYIHLSCTYAPLKKYGRPIEFATVVLSNGMQIDTLAYDENQWYEGGWYKGTMPIHSNLEYYLRVYAEDTLTAASTCTMPDSTVILLLSEINENAGINEEGEVYHSFMLSFQDDPNNDNYYEIVLKLNILYNHPYEHYQFDSKECLSDDPDVQAEGLSGFYHEALLFSDKLFNGKQKDLILKFFPTQYSDGSILPYNAVTVQFRCVSKAYYEYKRAFYMANEDFDFWSGMSDPITIPTNVKGGYGIFTGYTEQSDTIYRESVSLHIDKMTQHGMQ